MSLIETPSCARLPMTDIRNDIPVQNLCRIPIGPIGMAGGGCSLTCEIRNDILVQTLSGVTRDRRAIFILWGRRSTPPASGLRADFDRI
jgi:hypothetical protein